jgi:hypothetical protein
MPFGYVSKKAIKGSIVICSRPYISMVSGLYKIWIKKGREKTC